MIIDRQFLSARSIATLRLNNSIWVALTLAILASCGGGGGGGTSSPPPSNPVPSITSLSPASDTVAPGQNAPAVGAVARPFESRVLQDRSLVRDRCGGIVARPLRGDFSSLTPLLETRP